MAASTYFNTVEKLYIAFYQRPADPAGLLYWSNLIDVANGNATAVINAFATSAEATALYGPINSTTIGTVIDAIYTALYNRPADAAGKAFYVNGFTAGTFTAGSIAVNILNGATGTDAVAINNKVAVATTFTQQVDGRQLTDVAFGTGSSFAVTYDGNDLTAARAILKTVDEKPANTLNASQITTALQTQIANTGDTILGQVSGTTFTLTTGSDNITGTANNDTINASIDTTTAASNTLTAADIINGGAGTDTLNVVLGGANAAFPAASITNVETINVRASGFNLTGFDLSTAAGVTAFNADRSTGSLTVTNMAKGGAFGLLGDNSTLFGNVTESFGYASSADVATLNFAGGVKAATGATAVTLTGAGVTSTVINSTGAANTISTSAAAGVITVPATSKATTINATTNLTAALTTTADTKLTVTGAGAVDLRGVNYGSALNNAITTIDASAQTAGGTLVQAGNSTTLKFTGGAGNDSLGLGAVLATGAAVDGGAGTDTLYVAGNSAYITSGTGALIKNFEVVDVTTATVDLDNLATNNTLTGLRVGGSATVSNINAATAGNVTVYANSTPVLNVKGATTPGQLDTVKIDVNDGSAVVNTITLTAPTLTAVETLNVVATDNVTITSLANALALTGITFTGAGAISLTTTAIALNPNVTVDASAATGNFTLDATGATANGYNIKGSAGTNIITGGAAPIAVDITKSVAKADQVIITSATGSNGAVLQTISGFTNATTTGDKLDVINTGTITANVAAGTATGVTNLTAAVTNGVITFGGSAAATATLTDKINAAATLAGTTQYNEIAFEHAGNTYVYEQGDTTATYAAGVDLIVQLTGVTGVTALSTTASAANTIFAV